MGQDSKIEWTDHSGSPWWGCTHAGTGCEHCYAEVLSHRYKNDIWGNDKPRKEIISFFHNLKKYQRIAEAAKEVQRVFVSSMGDIFEKPMPVIRGKDTLMPYDTAELRKMLFRRITIGMYPNLQFLFLTKRPSNINKYIPEGWKISPPNNVMFGVSISNQADADTMFPLLAKVNGKLFASIEPQVGPVDLSQPKNLKLATGVNVIMSYAYLLDWVIVGGESGHGRRPFDAEWGRKIRDDCKASGTPFFMKQIDKIKPIPEDLLIRQFPEHGRI